MSAAEFLEIESRVLAPRLARDRMRRNLSDSIASAAASLRSMCNSVRNSPEWSKQRCPTEAPHTGHGTENSCWGVRSFIRMERECDKKCGKAAPFGTVRKKIRT